MLRPGAISLLCLATLLSGSAGGIALGASPAPAPPGIQQAVDGARRTARALRIARPPVIDGRLDEPEWSRAEPIGELVGVEPREGAVPSEATEVRFLFDADHLYIGIRCFDREPDLITRRSRERDANLGEEDKVEMVIDTYLDRRNAFFFQMNASGSKGDALITNNGADFNKPWDGIWEGVTTIDAEGWTVEMALPFKTLNFAKGASTWGFNIERTIGRRNETARWTGARQDVRGVFQVVECGDITGLTDIRQGIGLDVVPFFTGNWVNDRTSDSGSHLLGDPGLDVFYKLTPNLTASLTLNTDFAETEVDERQINLTRFPLFFPERRDFFLQDAGLFGFGNLTGRGRTDLLPFFSRTIGLVEGEEVPIDAGLKVTGRAGPYNIGVLDVQTGSATTADGLEVDGENLFVTRLARNVGEQSSIGMIVTHGDPVTGGDDVTLGLDANYRTNTFNGDKQVTANAWVLNADAEESSGDELAYGLAVGYPNDRWSMSAEFKEIQEDFDPALGFVPRAGIRKYDGSLEFSPRLGHEIRQLEFELDTSVVTDTDDDVETVEVELTPVGIEFESGDELRLEIERTHESLDEGFEIFEGIDVPADDYDFTRVRLEFDSAEKRRFGVEASVTGGEFFDGDRQTYSAGLSWRPNALFRGGLEYTHNDVSLEAGDFETQVGRLRADFSFSQELSWNSFVQWDNVSNTFGVNSRWRWIPRPGQELFFVFNQTLMNEDDSLAPLYQELAVKLVYTLRY